MKRPELIGSHKAIWDEFDRFRIGGKYRLDINLGAFADIVATWGTVTVAKQIADEYRIAAGLVCRIAGARPKLVFVPAEYLAPGHSAVLASDAKHKVANEMFALVFALWCIDIDINQIEDLRLVNDLVQRLGTSGCKEEYIRFSLKLLRCSASR